MKHIKAFFILSIFSFFAVTTIGQQDSGFTNRAEAKNLMVNGLKEGKWVEYYHGKDDSNSSKDSSYALSYTLTIYKSGKPNGIVREYYLWPVREKLKWEALYHNGEIIDTSKEYYPNGQLESVLPYKNGKKNGKSVSYWENGNIEIENYYRNGMEDGIEKTYNDEGKLMSKTTYKNDKKIATVEYDKYGNEIK